MTLKDYFKLLETHNWRSYVSDQENPGEYLRGLAAQKKVQTIAQESQRHTALYEDFCNFVYRSGKKPTEPT